MQRLISVINRILLLLIGCTLIGFFFFSGKNEWHLPVDASSSHSEENTALPKSPFLLSQEAYQKIGEGPFLLHWVPPEMLLPDLRYELVFLGKNCRPDVPKGKVFFYLSLKSSGDIKVVESGQRTYLAYQGNSCRLEIPRKKNSDSENGLGSSPPMKGNYTFSPGNQPTPLWLEMFDRENDSAEVMIAMIDDKGTFVSSPIEHQRFRLKSAETARFSIPGWEIGGHRVDATLLVRQRARWFGSDAFFEIHGGEEYAFAQGAQRIDFSEDSYSCFVKPGDFLIWNGEKWCSALDEDTQGYPLLMVKKVDDKVMSFELWDSEGKGKVSLSLIRSRDPAPVPELQHEFKFVGAKTWAQFIVECKNKRLILKPNDWLICVNGEWQKISSPEEVDDYVNQKTTGPLFVLEKMVKAKGHQVLFGHLFNTSRTEVKQIELPASQTDISHHYSHSISLPPPLLSEEGHSIEDLP